MKKKQWLKGMAVCMAAVLLCAGISAYASEEGNPGTVSGLDESEVQLFSEPGKMLGEQPSAGSVGDAVFGENLTGEQVARPLDQTGISEQLKRLLGGVRPDAGGEPAQTSGTETPSGTKEGTAENSVRFDENTAAYSGVWVTFEDGFRLYLPSDWYSYTPTDEQRQAGCMYQAGDAAAKTDTSKPYLVINCRNGAAEGITSVDDLITGLEVAGYGNDGIWDVNGIQCAACHMSSMDMSGMMFFGPNNPDLVFSVIGYRCEENMDTMSSILFSLSPYGG